MVAQPRPEPVAPGPDRNWASNRAESESRDARFATAANLSGTCLIGRLGAWQTRSPRTPTARSTSPTHPIIPFIEGDGTGVDIWPAAKLVLDAAAAKYGRTVEWKEVLAGEKAFNETGDWLPQETVDVFKEYLIGIKGPLTTPIGGGFRSLNVALRQILDLYVCLRPVRWFQGVPSPVKRPELVDMVIFRENTEDIYAGLEVEAGTPEAAKMIELLHDAFGWEIRPDSGIGIKPVSETGSKRLIRAAIKYAQAARPQDGDAGAQGQHHEVHRGRLPQLGLRAGARRVRRRGRGLGRLRRRAGRQDPGQGRHRRHHAAAGADPPGRVRRHRHHEPQRRLPVRRAGRPGGRHRHRARAATSTTSPATASSRPPTAPPPSTPARTRSTPARCCCRA